MGPAIVSDADTHPADTGVLRTQVPFSDNKTTVELPVPHQPYTL